MAKKKPKVGRPRRHEGMRLSKNRTFRIRDDLDLDLETAARRSGRSVSEEIEYRLDRTFLDGRFTPPRHEDAIRAVRLAMDASTGFGAYWPGPPFDDEQRAVAESVRTVVNIIIAAVAKLPVEAPPVEKWSTGDGEWARTLLEMIHVEWPQSLASFAKRMDEERQKRLDALEKERAEQNARFPRKTKKTPVKKAEEK